MAKKQAKHKPIPDGTGIKILLGVDIFLSFIVIVVGLTYMGSGASGRDAGDLIFLQIETLLYSGLFHALYVFLAGRAVKAVYPKWRGYAIGTAVVLVLGAVIAVVGSIVDNLALVFAGIGIDIAATLLLCIYHLKTGLGKRYALTYNQLLDEGYFDELERRKKADAQRETATIIEKAKDAADQTRVPGTKVDPVKPVTRFTGESSGTEPKPVTPPKSVTPPKPAASAEQKPESGEGNPTGHRIKL